VLQVIYYAVSSFCLTYRFLLDVVLFILVAWNREVAESENSSNMV